MARPVNNTPQGWQALSKEYFSGATNDQDIIVTIGPSEQANGDITVLRYFFPLAHGLHESGIIPYGNPVRLFIDMSAIKERNKLETSMRVKAFLAAFGRNSDYEIYLDNIKLRGSAEKWDGSNIFPLFEVSSGIHETEGNHYSILRGGQGISDTQCTLAEEALFRFRDVLTAKVLSADNYIGTQHLRLDASTKEQLIATVQKHLSEWLPQMDILSQIIWLYILRILTDTKEILKKNTENCAEIDENIILKCRIDAVTYGEGMYQLIENACLHSAGHKAWFGFRIHRAGGQIAMSDFLAEANTRNQLYINYSKCFAEAKDAGETGRRYGKNIFNEKHRFFFEMYVVDDAYTQNGIVKKYNSYIADSNRKQILPVYKKLWKEEMTRLRKQWKETNNRDDDDNRDMPEFEEPVFDENQIQRKDLWEKAEETVKGHLRPFLDSVEQIIDRKPREVSGNKIESLQQHIEDITTHYGLRLLRRIVNINNGYLMCKSPHGKQELQQYYHGNVTGGKLAGDSFITEWYALMPISYEWLETEAGSCCMKMGGAFGQTVDKLRSKQIYIDAEEMLQPQICTSIEDKGLAIQRITKQLETQLRNENDMQLGDAVVLIDIGECRCHNMELFSKALYALIAQVWRSCDRDENEAISVRIALLIPNIDLCNEFVRLFSMFYIDGTQKSMEDTQIAICSPACDGLYQVNYILAGTDLQTAWESANASAHYGSAETLERLPILSYLIQTGKDLRRNTADEKSIAFFPFDLYLNSTKKAGSEIVPWQDSWFINRMNALLGKELQDHHNGCFVKDVHIRLGSKVHLPCFYEAQLLFHDSSYIFRFAYLVAQDLLFGRNALSMKRHVFLLGYEKYSAQFVQQVSFWLQKSGNFVSVNAAIIRDGTEEGSVLFEALFDDKRCFSDAGVEVVSLLPVGTTLSTIYKMHNAAHKALPHIMVNAKFSWNYCMVLVNGDLTNPSGTLSEVTLRYWNTVEQEKKLVTLQRDKNDGKEIKVKYLLPAPAQWSAPDECTLCRETAGEVRPIISVTKSDVMPGSIFLLRDRRRGFFSDLLSKQEAAANNARISRLFGDIWYSHIYKRNNHYQFYIDFEKLFRENQQDILQTIKGWSVQPNAYNVVVSPLQVDNSSFIQAVLDCVFHGNSRFVHLEFAKSYREEVRTKFSHISEEFRLLKQANPNAKINIYFADISIVSGNILNRARVLLQMLLEESGICYQDVALFEKIFLLVNRCSFDTANSFVRDPSKNLKTYIHLFVPSYNVDEGVCPACNLTAKYRLLKKRSATDSLSAVFLRLEEKHKKRTREEYEEWLKEKVLHDPSYFIWLKQWLFTNVPDEKEKILCFHPSCREVYYAREYDTNIISEANDYAAAKWLKGVIEEYHRQKSNISSEQKDSIPCTQETLADVIEFSKTCVQTGEATYTQLQIKQYTKRVIDIVLVHLVGVRNFMRLYSLHLAYQTLENATKNIKSVGFSTTENQYKTIRSTMVEMIARAISPNTGKNSALGSMLAGVESATKARFLFAYSIEWLISYIKVLSREHLSNYYCYRQAIVSIMSDMLKISSSLSELEENKERLCKEDKNWETILNVMMLFHNQGRSSYPLREEVSLRAVYQYHLNMILLHRMADLQMRTVIQTDYIRHAVTQYHRLLDKVRGDKTSAMWFCLPTPEKAISRYLKSLKVSTMAMDDDIPCLSLCQTIDDLSDRMEQLEGCRRTDACSDLVTMGRYIYLENIRMLYSGIHDLRKQISQSEWDELGRYRPVDNFREYMQKLSAVVDSHLSKCYSNLDVKANEEDILYQNPLGNFCRFWHKANHEAPVLVQTGDPAVKSNAEISRVAYMLQYFIRLETLSKSEESVLNIDELPYQYEELCRTICGFTGAKMCYLVYCSDGNYPEIFAQSGYYVPFLKEDKILTPQKMDVVLRLTHSKSKKEKPDMAILLPGIIQINFKEHGFLVLDIGLRGDMNEGKHFHVVIQMDEEYEAVEDDEICGCSALRQARDILFMRETLQEVLSEHYTILANFRFDCSYIRPMQETDAEELPNPAVLHLSDLHIAKDLTDYKTDPRALLEKQLDVALKERKIDLLAITGDIADGRGGDAVHLINNYRYAEKLLDAIVTKLWVDDAQYLSHDWKRRVIITTGNHDYASMNQFKAILKQRVLSVGTPVEEDSGTMSKFAYFIDFLIRYLDPPVDELIQNDLNEVRYYRRLNLKVIALNCSSSATARRTNKLGPAYKKVEELLERKVWSEDKPIVKYGNKAFSYRPFKLCLAHYSDAYRLSYFEDNYDVIPGWEWDIQKRKDCVINQLVDHFLKAMRAELVFSKAELFCKEVAIPAPSAPIPEEVKAGRMPDWIKLMLLQARSELCDQVDYFEKAMELWENGAPSTLIAVDPYYARLDVITKPEVGETKTQAAKRTVDSIRKNDLYQEIVYYRNWVKRQIDETQSITRTDEHISRLIFEINESLSMSAFDKMRYSELFLDDSEDSAQMGGLNDNRRIDLLLAGHIHAFAEENKTLVTDKMLYEGKDHINGYIIHDMRSFMDSNKNAWQSQYKHKRL